ncbi:MAG: hypothetical protein R2714_00005, partial [Microthrixaceae bacterium]
MSNPLPRHRLVEAAIDKPRRVLWGALVLTLLFGSLIAFIEVDTDPENMLPDDHPVRERNAEIRDVFGAHDLVVVGVVTDDVQTPEVLGAVDELARTVAEDEGVLGDEVVWFASATGGEADVADQAAVDATVAAVAADPIVGPNVLTDDSTTTAVFVPLVDKAAAADVESIVDGFVEVTPALADTDVHVAG